MFTISFDSFAEYIHYFFGESPKWTSYDRESTGTGDDYKLKLNEMTHVITEILDARNVVSPYDSYKQHAFWAIGEILTECFALNPPLMAKYNPEVVEWAYKLRPDKTCEYTYGRRWSEFNQIFNVIKTLSERKDSKRAVIAIYTPYDTDPARSDVPCTDFYQFLIRDNKLHMTVMFRSHDILSGVRYDVILSSFMLQLIAMAVSANRKEQIIPGRLIMYDGSLHIYPNKDTETISKIKEDLKNAESIETEAYFNIMYPYVSVEEIYEDLWNVLRAQEFSYFSQFGHAAETIMKIKNPAFRDFARVYYNRNARREMKLSGQDLVLMTFETKALRW